MDRMTVTVVRSTIVERCPSCSERACGYGTHLIRKAGPDRYVCHCCRRVYSLVEYAWMQWMRRRGWKVAS